MWQICGGVFKIEEKGFGKMKNYPRTFPPKIQKALEEKGYFKISEEERIKSDLKTIEYLSQINKPSYEGAIEALRVLRGGGSE